MKKVIQAKDFDFKGFPKPDFRDIMIDRWMKEGCFKTRFDAIANYGGYDFDKLCSRCDGTTIRYFKYDEGTEEKECFEIVDNNFVIPVSAINIHD